RRELTWNAYVHRKAETKCLRTVIVRAEESGSKTFLHSQDTEWDTYRWDLATAGESTAVSRAQSECAAGTGCGAGESSLAEALGKRLSERNCHRGVEAAAD